MGSKENVLIICSQNSARSQMVEGFLKHYGNKWFNVYSAGFDPAPVNPLAIQVMAESGIDISGQSSKSVREFLGKMSFGHVIAVCKKAEQQCPVIFPSALRILSWPFDDPAAYTGGEEERLQEFRRIRNEIEMAVIHWLATRNNHDADEEAATLGNRPTGSQGRKRVLFLCTHNSARSQMAESLMNIMMGDLYEAYSAGIEPGKLNPHVVRALAEIDLDISGNQSKGVERFFGQEFDFVVTVCDQAGEICPFFPGAKSMIHHAFADPSKFVGTDGEIMEQVREVRDQIRRWLVETFPC
jgi:arsenate reductase